jgi:tetratricopeptide (TPR) repeat protein
MPYQVGADIVKVFLRGQNLEQLGRVDEAIDLYEVAVENRFDASGPYDRLIYLYADRARHGEVIRVAEAAIANVQTYEDKKAWYERMRAEALRARSTVPRAVPKKCPE